MFTKDTSAILDNFTRDSGTQNWKVDSWPNEPFRCYKINSSGCDVVVAKIKKSDWEQYDEDNDVTFNAFPMRFNLQVRLNGEVIQYGWDNVPFETAFPPPNQESAFTNLQTLSAGVVMSLLAASLF